jgi:hypothetical protein
MTKRTTRTSNSAGRKPSKWAEVPGQLPLFEDLNLPVLGWLDEGVSGDGVDGDDGRSVA